VLFNTGGALKFLQGESPTPRTALKF